jgi:hypothetical protein
MENFSHVITQSQIATGVAAIVFLLLVIAFNQQSRHKKRTTSKQ